MAEKETADAQELEKLDFTYFEPPRVKIVAFPTYQAPNVKDDMAVDALGPVPFQPTDVDVKRKIPFHDLKVPQQYRLMGYRAHNVHDSSSNYVPVGLMRELRSGAEDEVIDLAPAKLQNVAQGEGQVEERGQKVGQGDDVIVPPLEVQQTVKT